MCVYIYIYIYIYILWGKKRKHERKKWDPASRPGDGNYGRNNGSLQFYNSNNWNGNKIPDKNIQKIVDNELKDLIEKFGLGILKDRGKNMFLSKLVGTMDDFYPHQGWTQNP